MSDSGIIANYPWLVRQHSPRTQNPLHLLYQSSIINHFLPSLYLLLYPQINVALTPHERNFFLQEREPITESHNWSKSREQLMGCPAPAATSVTQPLYIWLRKHQGWRVERLQVPQKIRLSAMRLRLLYMKMEVASVNLNNMAAQTRPKQWQHQ